MSDEAIAIIAIIIFVPLAFALMGSVNAIVDWIMARFFWWLE